MSTNESLGLQRDTFLDESRVTGVVLGARVEEDDVEEDDVEEDEERI